jgi:hypothetical protein
MMMRALKAFEYNYRRVKAGEMFEALSDAHRMVLTAAKLAAESEDAAVPERKKQRYRHRKLEAEEG